MQSELNTAGVMWGCVEANTCDWEVNVGGYKIIRLVEALFRDHVILSWLQYFLHHHCYHLSLLQIAHHLSGR